MLVLTRKLQQQIKIGSEITVTILKVKGNTVRVGIDAPREVRVVRGELPKLGATTEVEAELTLEATEALAAAPSLASEEEEATAAAAEGPAARGPGGTVLAGAAPLPMTAGTSRSAASSGSASTAAPAPSAAHLPLGRLHARHGKAPLRHLIASCGALAK